jgi:predicted  nucleic acid-binding Zn-ribbon protein
MSAESDLTAQVEALEIERAELVSQIDPTDLERYEALRSQFGGVAIAPLNGRTCGGCHLDLSAVELETARRAPPDEMPECPQCGRLLAR